MVVVDRYYAHHALTAHERRERGEPASFFLRAYTCVCKAIYFCARYEDRSASVWRVLFGLSVFLVSLGEEERVEGEFRGRVASTSKHRNTKGKGLGVYLAFRAPNPSSGKGNYLVYLTLT